MRGIILFVTVFFALSVSSNASEPKAIELTIEPRAIESPALKYRLFPSEAEMKPGNAATILLRLPWGNTPYMHQIFPKFSDWESRPLDAPEWEKSNGVLNDDFYREMMRAAYRRDALWEYPIGEESNPYMILLPDVGDLRNWLGQGLSARIRYHLSRNELDEAREAILVGLANGRHIAQTPFYVNQMVAHIIHQKMMEPIDDLVSQPSSPNLYWALSTLPDSLVELERAANFESDLFAMTFPAVRDFDRQRTTEEWATMSRQMTEFLRFYDEIPQQKDQTKNSPIESPSPTEKTYLANLASQARADLPQMLDIPEVKVATMSDDEVSLRWYVSMRMSFNHHMAVTLVLAPREAFPELRKLQNEKESMQRKVGSKNDFPDPVVIYAAVWSLKRKIAALRIVEAVRHHLATHDGEFPASLDEIDDVPIPIDPMTDEAFIWKLDGDTAILTTPPLPEDIFGKTNWPPLEYRLRVK